jgi:hypothetical protein
MDMKAKSSNEPWTAGVMLPLMRINVEELQV